METCRAISLPRVSQQSLVIIICDIRSRPQFYRRQVIKVLALEILASIFDKLDTHVEV